MDESSLKLQNKKQVNLKCDKDTKDYIYNESVGKINFTCQRENTVRNQEAQK